MKFLIMAGPAPHSSLCWKLPSSPGEGTTACLMEQRCLGPPENSVTGTQRVIWIDPWMRRAALPCSHGATEGKAVAACQTCRPPRFG